MDYTASTASVVKWRILSADAEQETVNSTMSQRAYGITGEVKESMRGLFSTADWIAADVIWSENSIKPTSRQPRGLLHFKLGKVES